MRLQTALGGLLLFVLALLVIDTAQAQGDTAVTLTPAEPNGTIAPGGSMPLEVTVQAECIYAVFGGGTGTIDIAVEGDLPSGLTATGDSVTVDGQQCLESQSTTFQTTATITFHAAADAAGFVPVEGNVVASGENTLGGEASGSAPLPAGIFVGYNPGHTITPSGDQTFQVQGGTHEFDLQIDVQANAKTMVMFEGKQVPPGAKLDGLKAVVFDVAAGERSATLPVKFTAPSGDWEQVEATFTNFSHCMDGSPCDPEMEQEITWTFVNAGGTPAGNGGDGEDSPGAGLVALIGVVAIAALVVRRRA